MRLCKQCNKMLPLNLFRKNDTRKMCHTHVKEAHRKHVLGTIDKRAFNSLRCRSRTDLSLFDQKVLKISRKDVVALLTNTQLEKFSHYCIVPRDPTEPLALGNAAVITSVQRRWLMCNWKFKRNAQQYAHDLAQLLDVTAGHGAPLPNDACCE